MKHLSALYSGIAAVLLSACSTQPVQHPPAEQVPDESQSSLPAPSESGVTPPFKITKGDKILKLVRIMDGGACKNNLEGARGEFLIYADLDDIERIKKEKSPEIFKDLESRIEDFSSKALQDAIEATNLSEDPFSLGQDAAQEKLAGELIKSFDNAARPAIKHFQKETSLAVDVRPFPPSFVFYQQGCDLGQINPQSE